MYNINDNPEMVTERISTCSSIKTLKSFSYRLHRFLISMTLNERHARPENLLEKA
jgi:hypothetical protein